MEEGSKLPDFKLKNQDGEEISSKNIQNAVIYFYPKADTPGCTKEACKFRDSMEKFQQSDVDVYGISTDSVDDIKAFSEKYDLEFDLLADKEGEVSEKFDVLKESGYAERTTFLVKDGIVEKVFGAVDPEAHIDEVLEYL